MWKGIRLEVCVSKYDRHGVGSMNQRDLSGGRHRMGTKKKCKEMVGLNNHLYIDIWMCSWHWLVVRYAESLTIKIDDAVKDVIHNVLCPCTLYVSFPFTKVNFKYVHSYLSITCAFEQYVFVDCMRNRLKHEMVFNEIVHIHTHMIETYVSFLYKPYTYAQNRRIKIKWKEYPPWRTGLVTDSLFDILLPFLMMVFI